MARNNPTRVALQVAGTLLVLSLPAAAATVTVPDDYPTVQQAVGAASAGDTVLVRAGTYFEHVTIGKQLTLRGEDRTTTILDGSGSGTVVYVTADYVTVAGLTIRHGQNGIAVPENYSVDYLTVRDVVLTGHTTLGFKGMHIGHHTLIEDCVVSNNSWGISSHQFDSSAIRNCELFDNVNSGILVGWGHNSVVEHNYVHHNGRAGIYFDSMVNSIAQYNVCTDMRTGLEFGWVASGNTFRWNIVRDNNRGIIVQWPTRNNRIYGNDLIDNVIQGYGQVPSTPWDNGYPEGGNYWSDYGGADVFSGPEQDEEGADGIGDTPYDFTTPHPTLGSVHNRDRYPLMSPSFSPVAVCTDAVVQADHECRAEATVDGGSYDPNGGPVAITQEPPSPYGLGDTLVTLTVEDDQHATDACDATVTVQDGAAPVISCNGPGTLAPPDAPISFTASAEDNCGSASVEVTDYDCFVYTRTGKRVDKTDSCVVTISGDTVTVLDSGGVGDHITWSVSASDSSGNSIARTCELEVVNPAR